MTPLDIEPEDLERMKRILRVFVPDMEVWAFGSRVRGTASRSSDLDIVLIGDQPLPILQIAELKEVFRACFLPFKVDVIEWADIGDEFREIIRGKYEVLQGR